MAISTRNIAIAALAAAAYTALTILLAPISYGAVQFRVSEALCVLPFFMPVTAIGLFIGCAAANLLGSAGPLDVVFGSAATLLAGLCIAGIGSSYRKTGGIPGLFPAIFACAMPALFNGPIIGAVLALTLTGQNNFWPAFALISSQVMLGEAGVMYLIGLPALRLLPRMKGFNKLYSSI